LTLDKTKDEEGFEVWKIIEYEGMEPKEEEKKGA